MELSHLDKNQNPKMVDVSTKNTTKRIAIASGDIFMSSKAFDFAINNKAKKGPVMQTAIIAAIMAAKQTSTLIPMCHPINIESIDCEFEHLQNGLRLFVTVSINSKTGVEMEALTGVSVGLLTVYDMLKAIDKSMRIENIKLLEKSGGVNGDYKRC